MMKVKFLWVLQKYIFCSNAFNNICHQKYNKWLFFELPSTPLLKLNDKKKNPFATTIISHHCILGGKNLKKDIRKNQLTKTKFLFLEHILNFIEKQFFLLPLTFSSNS